MPRKRQTGAGGLYYIKSRKLWRAVVVDGVKPDGKPNQVTKHSRTQAGAREALEGMLADLREHGTVIKRDVNLSDWANHWLYTVQKPTMKPNGLKAYESITTKWIVPLLGRKKLSDLTPSDVRMVLAKMGDAGLSTGTVKKAHVIMSGMLDTAKLDRLVSRNVALDIRAPKVLTKERGALSTANAMRVLAGAASSPDGTRWWVALLGGVRQSERLGARIESFDPTQNLLHVEWALSEVTSEHGCGGTCTVKRGASCPQARLRIPDGFDYIHLKGRLCLIRPKSGKARTVPLIQQLSAAIAQHIDDNAHLPNPYGLIWRKANGDPYLPNEDQQAWRDILFTAGIITAEQLPPPKDRTEGIPDVPTTHWARHTTATVLMELGVDAKIIGEIVGHVDVKTTRGYQHVSSDAARKAIEGLGAHLTPAIEN